MTTEKVTKKIKILTLVCAAAAAIALLSFALQYLVLAPLGIGNTESFGLGLFLLTQFPFALIAGVMGFVAFFYGLRNPTWRIARSFGLVLGIILFLVFVMPLALGMILHSAPVVL